MIVKMEDVYNKELTDFLFKYNKMKDYYISWIPENYEEIDLLDKSNFVLCMENDKVVGCLGAYISDEQNTARLLGPIIDKKYFDQNVDSLYELFLQGLPGNVSTLKLAFFEENTACKQWSEKNGFELYNAEITMVYDKALFDKQEVPASFIIKAFEPQYKKGLEAVHPKEAFFTLNELIGEISGYHHLLLAIVQDEVCGYVYYEQTKDLKQSEIIFLHVREDKRGMGYGTLLLNRAIDNLIRDKAEQISVSVRTTNYRAQQLYRRAGFTEKETVYAYKKACNKH